jgi:hypothetical protein
MMPSRLLPAIPLRKTVSSRRRVGHSARPRQSRLRVSSQFLGTLGWGHCEFGESRLMHPRRGTTVSAPAYAATAVGIVVVPDALAAVLVPEAAALARELYVLPVHPQMARSVSASIPSNKCHTVLMSQTSANVSQAVVRRGSSPQHRS